MGAVQRVSTTVVALVGANQPTLARLGQMANVALCHPDASAPALDRAAYAWGLARRSQATYFVHDADPLVTVAEAWGRYFEGTGLVGELEVAVSDTVGRWRAGSLEIPDYYAVSSPDGWLPPRRHWYLGMLADACPSRVVVTEEEAAIAARLGTLPAGRWWPELDRLLDGIGRRVPDQARLPDVGDSPGSAKSGLFTAGGIEGSPATDTR